MFSPAQLTLLKDFVNLLNSKPDLLHDPSLGFFRQYLESLGATIPSKGTGASEEAHQHGSGPAHGHVHEHDDDDDEDDHDHGHSHSHDHGHDHGHTHSHGHAHEPKPQPEEEEEDEPEPEEEPETVDPDVIPAESDPAQPTGDIHKEVSDDDREKAAALRSEASEQVANGALDKAVELLTEAITKHNGSAAPLYATRGQLYLKLKKPASAIRDAEVALRINPDSATAFRVRGRANALLGHWETAVADLQAANMRDYDPDINDLIKSLTPKAHAVAEKRKAKDEREKKRKAKAARGASSGRGAAGGSAGGFPGGFQFPGGMPGGMPGGIPGGIPPELLSALMSDPELLAAVQDPTLVPILTAIAQDPTKMEQYKDHPKIGKLLSKFAHLFNK